MSHLLAVSVLVALLWPSHTDHKRAKLWASGKSLVLWPITKLGFIRVSTGPAFNATMEDARRALTDFIQDEKPDFIPADKRALDGENAPTSAKTTDWYLANLASAHGVKWITLDGKAKDSNAEVVP